MSNQATCKACLQVQAEAARLRARVAELEAIVKRVLKDAPRCVCEEQHHSRLDYHETGDLCPVEWRWSSVTAAALTALRPSKRGPTPDNQKRKDG